MITPVVSPATAEILGWVDVAGPGAVPAIVNDCDVDGSGGATVKFPISYRPGAIGMIP